MAFFLAITLLGVGAYYYLQLSWTLLPHSDAASIALSAWEMLHGNFFLHGWTLDANSAWLTEALVYMAGMAVTRDLDPGLMHIVPAVVFLAVVALAAAAATAGLEAGFARRTALIIAILPLVLLTRPMITWVLMGGAFHVGMTGVVLAAALVLYLEQRPRGSRMSHAALAGTAFALLVAGEMSDPYTAVLGVAPIAITSVWRATGDRPLARRLDRLLPAGIAVGAWIAATVGLQIVAHFGGFTPFHFARSVIPFAKLGESLSNLLLAFLDLGGANFFDRVPDFHFIAYVVRLAFLAGGVYAVWSVLQHPRFKEDWLMTVLSVAAVLAIVAGVLGDDTPAYRYRVPPLILMGVVLGRYVAITSRMWLEQRKALTAVLIVAVTLVFTWPPHAVLPVEGLASPAAKFGPWVLGQWLEQHGLTSGYGEYWIAPITTVETGGKVRVRAVGPVAVRGAVRVEPLYDESNAAWYTGNDATFLVLDPLGRSWDLSKAVPSQAAANTFGPPARVYVVVGRYVVLVWDKPLKF